MMGGQSLAPHSKILGFDGVRAICVLLVALNHLGVYPGQDSLFRVVNGVTGVQMFFVLSGFLITMLLIREHQSTGSISYRDFYLRRTLRILPPYIVLLVFVSALMLLGHKVAQPKALAAAWLYLTNFAPESWYSQVLAHTWSLAVEEHFYLAWPALFVFLMKPGNRGTQRRVLTFLAMMAFSIATYWFFQDFWHWYLNFKTLFTLEHWTMIASSNIALGAAGAFLLTGTRARRPWMLLLGSSGLSVVALGLLLVSAHIPDPVIGYYTRAVSLSQLIFWIHLNQSGSVVRALEFPPLRYIGQISYGIYIYQGLFLGAEILRIPDRAWPPEPGIGLLLLLLVAPLSFHGFEKPMMSLRPKLRSLLSSSSNHQFR